MRKWNQKAELYDRLFITKFVIWTSGFYRKLKQSYFPYFHPVKYGKRYVPKVPDVRAHALVLVFCRFAPSCLFFVMVTSLQYVDISDEDLVNFAKENENTGKKRKYDVGIFREYLDTIQPKTLLNFAVLHLSRRNVRHANLILLCLFLSL